jgi:hypothetical protein
MPLKTGSSPETAGCPPTTTVMVWGEGSSEGEGWWAGSGWLGEGQVVAGAAMEAGILCTLT